MNENTARMLVLAAVLGLVAIVIASYMNMTARIGANPENLIMQERATWVAIGSLIVALVAVLKSSPSKS